MLGKTADGRYLPTHLYLSPFEEKIKKYRCLFSHKSRFYKIYFWETGRPNGLLTKLIVGVKECPEQMN